MTQTILTRWIEAVEARSACMLAKEDPARASRRGVAVNAQPTHGSSLSCANSCSWVRLC